MATKNINARFRVKKDTAANWEKYNPILLDGEQIFVITAAGETRVKVGDGTKTYTQLPFTDEPLRTLISTKQSKDFIIEATDFYSTSSVLEVDYGFISINKTMSEIKEAYSSGKTLYVSFKKDDHDLLYIPLISWSDDGNAIFRLIDQNKINHIVIIETEGTDSTYVAGLDKIPIFISIDENNNITYPINDFTPEVIAQLLYFGIDVYPVLIDESGHYRAFTPFVYSSNFDTMVSILTDIVTKKEYRLMLGEYGILVESLNLDMGPEITAITTAEIDEIWDTTILSEDEVLL